MAETTVYTVTDISNALKGYVNKTRTAAHFDAPSFTAASKGTSEVVTKISQKRVRDSLQSIQRNAVVIRDNIAIVQSWANNVNEAPSMQDGLNAISCLTGDAADRHGAVRWFLSTCGTTEDQIRDTEVDQAVYTNMGNGHTFFV